VGAELFHSDRWTGEQTDQETDRHDEPNSHFSQFCKSTWKRQDLFRCSVSNRKKKAAFLHFLSWYIHKCELQSQVF